MKQSLGNKLLHVAQQFAVFHAWVASGSTSVRFVDLFTREVLTTWCKKISKRSLLRFLSLRIRHLVSMKEGDGEVSRRFIFKKGYPGQETNLGSFGFCLFSLSRPLGYCAPSLHKCQGLSYFASNDRTRLIDGCAIRRAFIGSFLGWSGSPSTSGTTFEYTHFRQKSTLWGVDGRKKC